MNISTYACLLLKNLRLWIKKKKFECNYKKIKVVSLKQSYFVEVFIFVSFVNIIVYV